MSTGTRPYILTLDELVSFAGPSVVRNIPPQSMCRLPRNRNAVPPAVVRETLEPLGVDYSFRVVCHINLRGGIGKTTASISLATRAAQYGFRTCVLDLDPQGSASLAFDRMAEEDDPIFYDVWQKPEESLMGALSEIQENLFILPSSLENGLLDASLVNPVSQKNAVRGVCEQLRREGFDLVVVDCPPTLGTAVISTICAADTIVVPVGSDAFSLKGIELTLRECEAICQAFGLELPKLHVLYSRLDLREKISTDSLNALRERYPAYLLSTLIRTSSEFAKALRRSVTVFAGQRASKARHDYDAYTREVLGLTVPSNGVCQESAQDVRVEEVEAESGVQQGQVEVEDQGQPEPASAVRSPSGIWGPAYGCRAAKTD